jgi:hypothetical protein
MVVIIAVGPVDVVVKTVLKAVTLPAIPLMKAARSVVSPSPKRPVVRWWTIIRGIAKLNDSAVIPPPVPSLGKTTRAMSPGTIERAG